MNEEIKELLNNLKSVYELNKPLTEKYKEDCMRFIINTKEAELLLDYITTLQQEIERLNNIISEIEKYIHNELILDFYNDDMPCEVIINKMEKMIKELKDSD